MSKNDLRGLARRWYNQANKGKAAAMVVTDEIYATNVVLHTTTGEDVRGLDGLKQRIGELYDGFPDIQGHIDDMIVEGDKIVIRYTMTGSHKGEFMGVPASNKKVTIKVIEIDRCVGDKAVEAWAIMDALGLMQQLGAVPMPKK